MNDAPPPPPLPAETQNTRDPQPPLVPTPRSPKSYYKVILGWHVRIPFVVLLLGLWSWEVYEGYNYEPEETWDNNSVDFALLYLDRELRLAEAIAEQPEPLRWFLLEESHHETLTTSLESLNALKTITTLGGNGTLARDVLRRKLGMDTDDTPLIDVEDAETIELLEASLIDDSNLWWQHEAVAHAASQLPPSLVAKMSAQDQQLNRSILHRAIAANCLSWGIFLIGLCFVPAAWKTLSTGLRKPLPPVRSYGWKWPTTLILALFVITDWIGGWFYSLAYQFAPIQILNFSFDVAVDFLWRFIPIILILVILFRRPSHAIRSFGLNRKPDWKLILGVYSILGVIDLGLYQLMQPHIGIDPTGGLEPMEYGWPGLFYGLLSACIAAPIAEELLYRGTLMRGLASSRKFWLAALISTLVFISCHYYDLYGSISVGIFGLSAALVYRATGSLIHAIALHALYNLSITSFTWLIYQSPL
jgi:membrane protease YdiL (CAAX protease family)